jgi:hypothetical protein
VCDGDGAEQPRHRRERMAFIPASEHPDEDTVRRPVGMITVQPIDERRFRVTVEGPTTTTHTVTLSPSYYEKLTDKRVTQEVLIEKSFEFLLERESNTSILRSFELPLIGRYFPEYEKTIGTRLAAAG